MIFPTSFDQLTHSLCHAATVKRDPIKAQVTSESQKIFKIVDVLHRVAVTDNDFVKIGIGSFKNLELVVCGFYGVIVVRK